MPFPATSNFFLFCDLFFLHSSSNTTSTLTTNITTITTTTATIRRSRRMLLSPVLTVVGIIEDGGKEEVLGDIVGVG